MRDGLTGRSVFAAGAIGRSGSLGAGPGGVVSAGASGGPSTRGAGTMVSGGAVESAPAAPGPSRTCSRCAIRLAPAFRYW